MFVEYNWTACTYQFRIGDSMFTDFRGVRSLSSVMEWNDYLKSHGFRMIERMRGQVWEVVSIENNTRT